MIVGGRVKGRPLPSGIANRSVACVAGTRGTVVMTLISEPRVTVPAEHVKRSLRRVDERCRNLPVTGDTGSFARVIHHVVVTEDAIYVAVLFMGEVERQS